MIHNNLRIISLEAQCGVEAWWKPCSYTAIPDAMAVEGNPQKAYSPMLKLQPWLGIADCGPFNQEIVLARRSLGGSLWPRVL